MTHRTTVRERRHRLSRDAYTGEIIVAVTACIRHREPLFTDRVVVEVFAHALRDAARRHDRAIVLHCFMPDHLHIVLRGDSPGADLWRAVVRFKQQMGFWINRTTQGLSWQKGFFDRIVRRDEDLPGELRYIANNSVRAGIVSDWREYPFLGSGVYPLDGLFSAA